MWEVKVAGLSAFVRGQAEWLRGSQAFDSTMQERASISLDLIDAGVFTVQQQPLSSLVSACLWFRL